MRPAETWKNYWRNGQFLQESCRAALPLWSISFRLQGLIGQRTSLEMKCRQARQMSLSGLTGISFTFHQFHAFALCLSLSAGHDRIWPGEILIRFCRSPSIIYRKPQQVNIEKSMEKVTWPLFWMDDFKIFQVPNFSSGDCRPSTSRCRNAWRWVGTSSSASVRAVKAIRPGRWMEPGHPGTPRDTEEHRDGWLGVWHCGSHYGCWDNVEQFWLSNIDQRPSIVYPDQPSEAHETTVGRLLMSAGAASWQGNKEPDRNLYQLWLAGKCSVNGGFKWKILYKWETFNCNVWLINRG